MEMSIESWRRLIGSEGGCADDLGKKRCGRLELSRSGRKWLRQIWCLVVVKKPLSISRRKGDEEGKLVGVVSDYDLLALDSVSGNGRTGTMMFPEVDSTWKLWSKLLQGRAQRSDSGIDYGIFMFQAFNEIQKLLSKTNGIIIGDVMTPAPLVVHETTNLEDAARLLLQTKYRRLPVVDDDAKLPSILTWLSPELSDCQEENLELEEEYVEQSAAVDGSEHRSFSRMDQKHKECAELLCSLLAKEGDFVLEIFLDSSGS
ncbi:hypothetical protein ZIOFF_026434 [Zingiber officinale]|uniref:CBS domain-containing protein n=1 Tax=Zingiber officinale TaxID=94328 RepID=A0A8J5LKH4_ZINOF|nr:hypothetical protein ZIOFF_026434 [Zingiber officinale]